jgi:FkbH-like protein
MAGGTGKVVRDTGLLAGDTSEKAAGASEAASARGGQAARAAVKCVVWDADHTLLDGVFLEAGGEPPGADPAMVAVLAELSGRGILHAIASRNPPAVAEHVARVTGAAFVAAECGWDAKSEAIGRIAGTLGIGTDAIAFVDDDPYERAEVSFARPEVMVLAPAEMASAPGWPEFSPAVVTAEAARRSQLYLDRQRRQAAEREFGGSREEFLRWCQTEITIGPAGPADVDRLAELSARTHQFNSAARALPAAGFTSLIAAGNSARVLAVRLRDRFGDDGLVGTCVTEAGPDGWTVTLLAMSCRAMGRGVIDALLAWLIGAAAQARIRELAVPAVLTPRNVPLRLALAAAGFRASAAEPSAAGPAGGHAGEAGQQRAVFRRAVDVAEAAASAGAASPGGAAGPDGTAAAAGSGGETVAGGVPSAGEAGDGEAGDGEAGDGG